jgi:hypothetical protein
MKMESDLFLNSKVEIWRHNIIGHVCGTGSISESVWPFPAYLNKQIKSLKTENDKFCKITNKIKWINLFEMYNTLK